MREMGQFDESCLTFTSIHIIPSHLRLPHPMKLRRASTHPPNTQAFTLVEIMIVVAIIALLAAIAVPALMRARKRSQAGTVRIDLRLIDDAMEQYGAENGLKQGANVPVTAWRSYMKPNTRLYSNNVSIFGDTYGPQVYGILPTVPSTVWDMTTDVCDSTFWAPYVRSP